MENDLLVKIIADIASEEFRFRKVFEKVISKLDYSDQNKFINQYSWFSKKVQLSIDQANINIVSVEGKPYDIGMAVKPLNLEEFEEENCLIVEQMLEPIIMHDGKILKMGTVILGRDNK